MTGTGAQAPVEPGADEPRAFAALRRGRRANHQMLMMVPITPTPAATPVAFFPALTTRPYLSARAGRTGSMPGPAAAVTP